MPQTKKMSLTQLTFIVAVNMMGSGIIMLPTNMAQVGAISLLSWIVTAVGSMAIAYGFAQAGIFNQRAGGLAAYAEEAYGKAGYFQTFFLYFISLAIANVAVAISAVGYLSAFFPWLSATPVATTLGVIGLLWITTVANFGGPAITGRIGSVTVWGVILPVGLISIIGWFWFKGETFAAAWNPQGLSIAEGMGSSIALTLWAFLGMESAAQNSGAVENPKRNVPLACLFGTLGAAVIYVLSTTVIAGIVPNAELAESNGPFGLAFATMFNPTVGSIVMALAAMACVGSLLGWQFTLAEIARASAAERMFPTMFGKVNRMGAPIAGMLVLGVVQSIMALSTISPNLSEQFGALVNLAVVTNVLPYIIALSALKVMMQSARVERGVYLRNMAIALVATLYSTFAIWAAGLEAVMGGVLVMAVGYIIWGLIAARFTTGSATATTTAHSSAGAAGVVVAAFAIGLLTAALPQSAEAATGSTLDRVKQSGTLRLGYRTDARPFAFRDESGSAAGYSVALCRKVAAQVKSDLGISNLNIEWVPVTLEGRFRAVRELKVDLLCEADAETLARRQIVAFSIPVFPGGIGALLRTDSSWRLREILNRGQAAARPLWRGSPAQVLGQQTLSAIDGTTGAAWLAERKGTLKLSSRVIPLQSYEEGLQRVLDRSTDVFFADRAILLDLVKHSTSARQLKVLDRQFTHESIALALPRGDEDFRLLVDRTLSRLFESAEFGPLYAEWFGEPEADALDFFRRQALPE